jgi:hypothetical protein
MKKHIPITKFLLPAAVALGAIALASPCSAAGRIDAGTLVSISHGNFKGVHYTRYEAMFEGVTANQRPYRVPCQIVAPTIPAQGNGSLLFDWLVPSTIETAVGQEQADARYTLTDEFIFGSGWSYATVRGCIEAIGRQSPISDYTRPWSDDLLDTSSEFIVSAGDEFDIVVDYVKALRSDPVALGILGRTKRTAAFGYSASGWRVKGLLRLQIGKGLFDFSLVGGTGSGFVHPIGNGLGESASEKAPLPGCGLEINFQSETEGILAEGYKTRRDEPNYRVYQFAGAAHIRAVDAAEFGLADPETANPADWVPFFRALFVAGNSWCDGIQPPPSLWLGAPNDPQLARDSRGNALVRYVGGQRVNTTGFRLPEVAVGENQYIPVDTSYDDGTFLGFFRVVAGSHVDLTGNITDHDAYVRRITAHARALEQRRYLLKSDADAIILRAKLKFPLAGQ